MRIIIDAYNVLKNMVRAAHVSAHEREQFINQLVRYARKKGHQITLVFDGGDSAWPSRDQHKGMAVVHTGQQECADTYIKRLLKEHKAHDPLLVSSDRELCVYAEKFNLVHVDAHAFIHILRETISTESMVPLSDAIVKLSHEKDNELDALMHEAAHERVLKQEEGPRKKEEKQKNKWEKRLLQKLKKL